MTTLANYVAFHIDKLYVVIDDNNSQISLKIDHIYVHSELSTIVDHKKVLSIQFQLGPTTLQFKEKPILEMSTAFLFTISCHFRARRLHLNDLDINFQLGKTIIDLNNCIEFVLYHRQQKQQQQKQTETFHTQSTPVFKLEDILNTIKFRIQSIHFNYLINREIITNFDVSDIQLFYSSFDGRHNKPSFQLNTETITFFLAHHRVIYIPTMEMSMSLPEEDTVQFVEKNLPYTDLISIIWIINTPLVQFPFQSKIIKETLQYTSSILGTSKQTTNDHSQVPQKLISDLPMCNLAIVLNSPKLILADIGEKQGYMSSNSLILRFSGEYIMKSRNSTYDDVPSSSSTSASSNLDILFAREEYKWLSSTTNNHYKPEKSNSFHEFNPFIPDRDITKRRITTTRLLNLMGRVSRHRQQHNRPGLHTQHKKWNYKVSVKIILQRASVGYEKDNSLEEFVRIKSAVIIGKSNMNVVHHHFVLPDNNKNIDRYDILFALGQNTIHTEAAIDKPIICLCQQDIMLSASYFWLKSIPQAIQNQYLDIFLQKDKTTKTSDSPVWVQSFAKNLSFSLDVTEGSIVAWSVDTSHRSPVDVPKGYLDNTPPKNIYTRIILDTQKFTFVHEGMALILDQSQWRSRCHLEKLYIHQSSTGHQDLAQVKEFLEKDEKQHVILWISQLNFGISYSQLVANNITSNIFNINAKVKKIGVSYSIRNHYTCLLFGRSLIHLKEKLGNSTGVSSSSSGLKTSDAKNLVQFNVDINIKRADTQVGLPFDKKVYFRMDEFNLQKNETIKNTVNVQFRNAMLLGESPLHEDKWEQLVELDLVQIFVEINPVFSNSLIELKAKKIFATVPYKFVLSAIIDSIIGLVKAIKELHARILNLDPNNYAFTYFGPSIKNEPILIPFIKLRTKLFSIYFDDDPFESKLRNILRTGLFEQQKRLAYEDALDAKIQEMTTIPEFPAASMKSQQQQESDQNSNVDTVENQSTIIESNESKPKVTDFSEIQPKIIEAQKSLLEYFSEFWIKHINKTKNDEEKFYKNLFMREHYRNSETEEHIDMTLDDGDSRRHGRFLYSKTFTINIVPRPLHPPLAGFSAQYAKVHFKQANFSLNDTRNFIHHTGGGVPLDSDFSIIIPFHLSIKAGKTWIKVRDYPLPLLYVPPPPPPPPPSTTDEENNQSTSKRKRKQSRVSWSLEGDYVAGDELGNSGGSRIIPITIISKKSDESPGYCLSAIRTASPLKFYSIIDYQVYTKEMSMICWSVSYNSAIQDILHALDTLTAAQVDPSPRIGFWDKVRFLIHSRIKIDFVGGGDLAFVVKGTRDPYQLMGRGAGLAKVWSDNVVWLLGHRNEQKEFMQIISDNYAFGVPDLIRGSYVPNFPDSLSYNNNIEPDDNLHQFSKVALKLSDGIRMGIGLSFERLSCNEYDTNDDGLCFKCESQQLHAIDRCRSQIFSPHYNVLFQSVEQVEKHFIMDTYDAFRGFRSDFIHLSFSIVKLENEVPNTESPDFSKNDPYFDLTGGGSHNAMYLSPCFIEHFADWYGLFGSPVSLPIRQGKLFPTDEPKAKSFGELLNTIKYKIVVDPLAIGMFFTDLDTYMNIKGGGSVGLKARVSSFSVDLHQRREVIRSCLDSSLKDTILKTEINIHEAEVQLTDIDLRVIKAIHYKKIAYDDQKSSNKSTTRSYSKSISESTSIPLSDNHTDGSSSYSAEDNNSSFRWTDSKDFVLLDSATRQLPHYSKIEVYPFAYSPLFHFVRQTDELDTEKREYLRETHDCIFGKGIESHEFQKTHLDRRASDLDKLIESHDKQLDIIIHAIETFKGSRTDLKDEYDLLVKKIDNLRKKRYMLHAYLAQLILEKELTKTQKSDDRDSPNTTNSSICRRDEISRWQMLMGHFKDRFSVHYPQIIWNSSVKEALFYLNDIRSTRSIQHFNLTARCLKFLEELVQAAEKQKQWKPDVPDPNTNNNEAGPACDIIDSKEPNYSDENMTEALIEKLLSERTTNFVAYNEKEEEKNKNNTESTASINQSYDGIHVFESSKNFNDPDYQYQSIPNFYTMNSSYLVDLIHPQIILQSNKGLDHLILLTNERIHVKGLTIMDNAGGIITTDKDINLVKKRVVAGFDNAQILIAKKVEEVQSYSFLAQNCYGQFQEKHWAVWIQPEQLWYFREAAHFENFQKVATQLTGSMQIDTYNNLRIKINKYNISRKSPFEDRTNTLQLHLPHFKIVLSSEQAHIFYYTVTDLVLGNDGSPKTKLKLSKSHDVLLAAERSDLAETVKQVGVLQNSSRNLLNIYRQFRSDYPYLDVVAKKEFNKIKKRMRENLEKLYHIVEAIRSIQMFRRDIHLEETNEAMRFTFTSDEIVWEAMLNYSENSSLCKWILNNLKFVLLNKPNGSSKSALDIDRMRIKNTTKSPIFKNVLDSYIDPTNPVLPDYSRHKMLSGVLDLLPPVGGIAIIQHLEINLLPLNLQLSKAFADLVMDYFFPKLEVIDQPIQNEQENNDILNENEYFDSEEYDDETSINELQIKSSIRSPPKREGSFMSIDSITKKVKSTISRKRNIKADELTVMKTRSSANRTFIYVRIPSAKHCISIRGPSQNSVYNIYNFMFKQPKLEYRNMTWSMAEMTEKIKKEFTFALLKQSPALLKKKLSSNNKQVISNVSTKSPKLVQNNEGSASDFLAASRISEINLMDESFVFDKNYLTDDSSKRSGYNTDDDDGESYYDGDVKSLYSNDPEDEQERLEELQMTKKGDMKPPNSHKEGAHNELIEKGRILFGIKYNGPTSKNK